MPAKPTTNSVQKIAEDRNSLYLLQNIWMLFNSLPFLLFFPIVTIIYFILPHKFRWIHLLLASCIFYCFFIPIYLIILLVTILIDYFAAIYIENSEGKKRKAWLIVSIVSTCLVLFIFKYFNFFNANFSSLAHFFNLNYPIRALNIILPIGLSFHTFQSLSYVIEVFRGHQKAEKNFGIYSLYVMFYPQLVAGPIERPQNIIHQLHEKHYFNYDDAVYGLKKMVWGMFKKVVIADRLSLYVNAVYNNSGSHSGKSLLLATIFFSFQIYCDFSGYSDIAIGSARVMGIKLMTNFNRPYFAKSVSEFWKRWHISLSTWFRDYLYISLGGNRVSNSRKYLNLFITFLISGFWHGANWTYAIWGGLNGFYLVCAQFFYKQLSAVGRSISKMGMTNILTFFNILVTYIFIWFSWIFFRAKNISEATAIIRKIAFDRGPLFLAENKTLIFSLTFLSLLLVVELVEEYKLFNNISLFNNSSVIVRRLSYAGLVICILMFGVFDNSQFIYFQF